MAGRGCSAVVLLLLLLLLKFSFCYRVLHCLMPVSHNPERPEMMTIASQFQHLAACNQSPERDTVVHYA